MIKRGEIYYADLNPTRGSEISKTRPVLIISNNINNINASTVTIIPLTTYKSEKIYPFEVLVKLSESGLPKDSKIKANQIRTIDKSRLLNKTGEINSVKMREVEKAVCIHLEIDFS